MLSLSPPAPGPVLALGNFDGVHRGHQVVLAAAREEARRLGTSAFALTMEPHPRRVFWPDSPSFRLTPPLAKERLVKALGLAGVIALPFSHDLARLTPDAFITTFLVRTYQAVAVVVGEGFVFGAKRAGSVRDLEEGLAPSGASVLTVPRVSLNEGGAELSSTCARSALMQGDLGTARAILGRSWSILGEVTHGQRLGRHLGFPTANIALGDYLHPRAGVYAVRVRREGVGGGLASGVANIGFRPTVQGKDMRLEVHLLEAPEGEAYGQTWEVFLESFLRPERPFPDLDALAAQIGEDVRAARCALVGGGGRSPRVL